MPNLSKQNVPILVEGLSFSYPNNTIIKQADFRVLRGHTTMLVGDNGAGKSTLIKLVLGELKPTFGSVFLFGQNPVQFKDWDKVGYVGQFQVYSSLGFPATVLEVLVSGLPLRKRFIFTACLPKVQKEDCMHALESCGVVHLAGKRICDLSGGQRQRVMLARALVKNPELLVLDEPTASLDAQASDQFFALLEDLCHKNNLASLVVTHDRTQVSCSHAEILRLQDGYCIQKD